jgi:glycosyltransferase involved in cell wall biosynthesis
MTVVAALIPALNEEEPLPRVLDELRAVGIDQVVVVDNGSTDATAQVAREGGARVVEERRRGYGAACLAGMAHIATWSESPSVLLFLDGDGSDDPRESPRLLDPILADEVDFVVGVREKRHGGSGSGASVPLHARLGDGLIRLGARWLHGVELGDLGPFRAIRWSSLQALEMDDQDWGWTLQMQLRAHRAGLRYREVNVSHRRRTGGRSKVSGTLLGSLRAGVKMVRVLLRRPS